MAQDFKVNGTTINRVTGLQWLEQPVNDKRLNGQPVYHRWRRHLGRARVVTQDEFDTLFATLGTRVELTTVDYADRNGDYKTYYTAEAIGIEAVHEGPAFVEVEMEFWVRL